jgi:tetratricopeptide (TPR) repeat protein
LGASTATAQPKPAQPPSPTLERGLSVYDSEDYLSASIELLNVVDEGTNDSVANRQRAEFFLAKTLFQLKLHVAALAMFDRVATAGSHVHRYHAPTLKWLIAIGEHVPVSMLAHMVLLYVGDLDDPMYIDVRDRVATVIGSALMTQGQVIDAATLFETVAPDADEFAAATIALGTAYASLGKWDESIAAFKRTPSGSDHAAEAYLALAQLYFEREDVAQARTYYTLAGEASGPAAELARIEAFVLLDERHPLAAADRRLVRALLYTDYCASGHTHDAMSGAREDQSQLRAGLDSLLDLDDDAELYDAVAAVLASAEAGGRRQRAVVGAAIAADRVADVMAAVDALDRELALVSTMDSAWRTTAIADLVQTELVLRRALAVADAGKALRPHLAGVWRGLPTVVDAPSATTKELGAVAAGCPDGPPPEPPADPEVPVVVKENTRIPPHAPNNSCVGCSSSSGASNTLGLAFILLLAARRRTRS